VPRIHWRPRTRRRHRGAAPNSVAGWDETFDSGEIGSAKEAGQSSVTQAAGNNN
jgi:hypothetical protein